MKVSADSPSPVPTQASTGDSKGSESKPFAKVLKEKADADAGDSSEKDYFSFPRAKKPGDHAGAIDWIQSRFKKGRLATLYYDEVRTPAYTDCLNRLYERVLASDLCGVYNAGGPLALSLFEIARL